MIWKKLFNFGRSKETEFIVEQSGISQEALAIVKRSINGRIHPFYKVDLYTEKPAEITGICVEAKQEKAEQLVLKLKEQLKSINYLPFICESDREKIGIIPGSDQFDILRVQQTNGDNYDISNEKVISKLKDWYRRYPFIIIGADYDWVEANFEVFPEGKALKAFAKEIYKFCPDIVEQGSGSINGLIEEMEETRKLYLWWD
ncbi:DUF4253 domain-containing protein [Mesobacillus selenatarsenatis]|uniref:Hypothetical cytosolic protein n=1 Tax=Mesobacillus selenatarsenatis (strain DSM 18680 / JCM 14380 / FERM P-15431 / SF-1) TaxID=1321606 RepID=A0A0A8X4J6_MESS1|nr:DUF4253 domain-containing protein [Mesobacillus selenatarsenatis]GAM14885.1 hypothetical cytosolic protein [Mesobacillus selenatarsenatis SF-1]